MLQIKRSMLVLYGGIVLILVGLLLVWPDLRSHLFSTAGPTPFARNSGADPSLIALLAGSNTLIGTSFVLLSGLVGYLIYRLYKDIQFNWIPLTFAGFLLACGITYLLGVLTLWTPLFWLAGYVRLVTAIASVATTLAFPLLIPRALAMMEAAKTSEERKRQLEAANLKLESLYSQQVEIDHIKSNLFAGISHELRTPLTLLLGSVQHLLTDSTLTAAQRSALTVAERNGLLLQHHVDDLLDVSQLQIGQTSLVYSAVDLAVRMKLITSYFEIVAQQRKITFSVDAPPSLPAEIDVEKAEHIILNLLHQAFKSVPVGGELSCSLSTQHGYAVIAVQDNGPQVKSGLSEFSYERIEQDHSETSPYDESSSGLGLAIAREYTLLHGGSFILTNTPDGPRFEAALPMIAPVNIKVQPGSSQSSFVKDIAWQQITSLMGDSRRVDAPQEALAVTDAEEPVILVVEDNVDMNRFISLALAQDYQVLNAFDGQEGLEKALTLKPDLIISDLMMPRMGGEKLVQQLQVYPDTALIPVMLLTARPDSELRVRLLRAGAKDYLVKPFSVEELSARVDNLIVQKRAQDTLQEAIVSQEKDVVSLLGEVQRRTQELEVALGDLQISESRFRRLAEANIIGIVVAREPGRLVTEANDAFLNMVGYSREELSMGGIYLRDITPPEYASADAIATAEARQSGVASPRMKEYTRKDGTRVPVMIGFATLDGQPDSYVGFAVDLTERKKNEEAQRFITDASSVLAASLDMTATLDNLCNLIVPRYADRCTIDLVNQDGNISRVTIKDILPSNERLAVQMQERKKTEEVQPRGITRTLQTGESQFYPEVSESDLSLYAADEVHLDGLLKLRMTSHIIVPLKARGRILGAMSLVFTTSGRHYTTADLTLMEDLARRTALAVDNARLYEDSQQAIRIRDEFMSVAAHELKTPITSLRGFAQVTLRHLEKSSDFDVARTKRALKTIDQQSDKLARLVTQLLSIARLQAGRLTLDHEQLDFVHIVEDVIASAQMRTTRHTITLRTPANIGMIGDPLRLEQVITNLVDNAIKYSPDGGPIDIDIIQPEAHWIQLTITDRGIGIAPEHRNNIFKRFYQAQQRTYLEGIGLGLYISQEIVDLHGGKVRAEFPPEGGTRFIIDLPTGNGQLKEGKESS